MVAAKSDASHNSAASEMKWRRLLHIDDKKSEAKGLGFFLSTDKEWSALKELQATIDAINSKKEIGNLKLKAHCAFPARAEFLEQKKFIAKQQPCERVEKWINGMAPSSISLIFASAYANNPSSIFGHTFLRVNSENKEEKKNKALDLLDYGLNFAASIGDDGPLSFVYRGVFGLYEGHFSVAPYYIKVNEYSNFENRDLWEYELNLTRSEVITLIRHIWEIEYNTNFSYYFFDENCSYMILRLIEVVRPHLNIKEKLKFYVSPLETVKEAKKMGLVSKTVFRPSLRTRLKERLERLSKVDKEKLYSIIEAPKKVKADLLDTAILYFKLKKHIDKGMLKEDADNFSKVLIIRSKDKSPLKKISPQKTDPIEGHDSMGIEMGYLNSNSDKVYMSYSPGVHHIMDNSAGYIENSSLNFLEFTGSFSEEENKFYIEKFIPFEIESFAPFKTLSPNPSFRIKSEFYNTLKNSFHHFGMGITLGSFYLLPSIYLLDSKELEYGLIGETGLMLHHRWFRLNLSYNPRLNQLEFDGNEYKLQAALFLGKDYSLQMNYNYFDHHKAIEVGIKGHF
ncbi:MAG: DUF4105 domain-containing protein [Bacteriovoracaceae bacterium]|nr:DUF4105 domain-containing protein [Bacteriovoracaceae bacterium]